MTFEPNESGNHMGAPQFHHSNRGYKDHWQRVGSQLEEIRRRELQQHGPRPFDWQLVDSLLQLGFLHGDRNPPTGLIQWQARLAAAYQKKQPDRNVT